jgi:hypothetical protein
MQTSHWYYYPQVLGHASLQDDRLIYRPKCFTYDDDLIANVLEWSWIDNVDDLQVWQAIEADLKARA